MPKYYYTFWFLLLLAVEVCIALFVKTGILRHFVGDILAVILVYCFLRLISRLSIQKAALVALSVGFVIELIQFTNIVSKLGLDDIGWLAIILGSTADLWDLFAYSIGFFAIILFEFAINKLKYNMQNNKA